MNKSHICCIQFCCKFCQLYFCLILFKLVFISHCYHESNRGELFLKHSVEWLFVSLIKMTLSCCIKTEMNCQRKYWLLMLLSSSSSSSSSSSLLLLKSTINGLKFLNVYMLTIWRCHCYDSDKSLRQRVLCRMSSGMELTDTEVTQTTDTAAFKRQITTHCFNLPFIACKFHLFHINAF